MHLLGEASLFLGSDDPELVLYSNGALATLGGTMLLENVYFAAVNTHQQVILAQGRHFEIPMAEATKSILQIMQKMSYCSLKISRS